eukprot:EG_transcript_24003
MGRGGSLQPLLLFLVVLFALSGSSNAAGVILLALPSGDGSRCLAVDDASPPTLLAEPPCDPAAPEQQFAAAEAPQAFQAVHSTRCLEVGFAGRGPLKGKKEPHLRFAACSGAPAQSFPCSGLLCCSRVAEDICVARFAVGSHAVFRVSLRLRQLARWVALHPLLVALLCLAAGGVPSAFFWHRWRLEAVEAERKPVVDRSAPALFGHNL